MEGRCEMNGAPHSPTKVLVGTGGRAALLCVLDRHLSLFSSFPATALIQLGYSKLHGDAMMYKPPLDVFTCGWQLLKAL